MTLDFAAGVTGAALFVIAAAPIVLFVTICHFLKRWAHSGHFDRLFAGLIVVGIVDCVLTVIFSFMHEPLRGIAAAGLSGVLTVSVDPALFQDILHASYLAVAAALFIVLARELGIAWFDRLDRDHPLV